MDVRERAYATMITNFDSTEQRSLWQELSKQLSESISTQRSESMCDMSRLWCKNRTTRTCERIINDHPEFATTFAGIIRTAYLYCPKIMISDAQLFDGVFFLALGPRAVNGILGKSYKDGPAIIVSGREQTLEDCLRRFTVTVIDKNQHTIRPLEYSALGGIRINDHDVRGLARTDYQAFDDELRNGSVAHAVATMMARVLQAKDPDNPDYDNDETPPDAAVEDRCRFLGERWQEWIDAEREGLVLYENQNDPHVKERTRSEGFDHYFQRYGSAYAASVLEDWGFPSAVVDVYRAKECPSDFSDPDEKDQSTDDAKNKASRWARWRQAAIEKVVNPDVTEPTMDDPARLFADILATDMRSQAFDIINDPERCKNPPAGLSDEAYRNRLRDWYQLSYQQALARHLGAQLVAVDKEENSVEQIVGCASRGASLMLSGTITQLLGDMPYVRFVTFCYETRSSIERWRTCEVSEPRLKSGNDYARHPIRRVIDGITDRFDGYRVRRVTRGIAYAVEQASEEKSLSADARNLLYSTAIAVVLALVSATVDNALFNEQTPIWLLVFVAWLIDVVPIVLDVAGWLRNVHSNSKTVAFIA